MSHGPIVRAIRELGLKGTFDRLYRMRTIKFGKLVGTDVHGNKYYENNEDYPHPLNRWVEYNGGKNFYETDSSWVPPEWHGWLHNVTADPPTETTVGSVHKYEPLKNAHGSSAPYSRNLGGVITKPVPNYSQYRPRGYGLGNGIGSRPNEEHYWTQPGYPTDPRNSERNISTRRQRLRFTLKDTPLTIQAKEAVKSGFSLQDYQRYTDDDHPTKALLLLTGGNINEKLSKEILQAADNAGEANLLDEALSGVPNDPAKRDLATRLAAGLTPTKNDKGTFAAEVASLLTPEEEALLNEQSDITVLEDKANTYQRYIDEYTNLDHKDAKKGIAKAVENRDNCLDKISKLKVIYAKLATLDEKYNAKAYEMASDAIKELV